MTLQAPPFLTLPTKKVTSILGYFSIFFCLVDSSKMSPGAYGGLRRGGGQQRKAPVHSPGQTSNCPGRPLPPWPHLPAPHSALGPTCSRGPTRPLLHFHGTHNNPTLFPHEGHWSLSHYETQFLEATDSHARGTGDGSPVPVIRGERDLSAEQETNKGEQQRVCGHSSTVRSQRSQVPPIPHYPHGHAAQGVETETQF